MIFCLIIFGVLTVAFNLFRVVSLKENIRECMMPFMYACSIVLYMFIANCCGQAATNHSDHVFTTVYNVKWYIAPLHLQRMILFLLQKNYKKFTFNISGLFTPSMECFATLVKASVSYFTFIYSTQ